VWIGTRRIGNRDRVACISSEIRGFGTAVVELKQGYWTELDLTAMHL